MKLLNKTSIYYLLFALPVFAICSGLLYYFVATQINNSLDESLAKEKNTIATNLKKGELVHDMDNEVTLMPVDLKDISNKNHFSDTLIYDSTEMELLPFRLLKSQVSDGSKNYIITIRTSHIESDDLITSILYPVIILFIVLLLGFFGINFWISKKLWNPFYKTLKQLTDFNIDQTLVKFDTTAISEFSKLNEVLTSMTQKIHTDYINQKQFIENASHEIQTPLAVIKSKIELLIQSSSLSENDMQLIQKVYNASNKLSSLNKALLLLSKIDNNQFKEIEQVHFNTLVDKTILHFEELISLKNISITKQYEQELAQMINPVLADILITNLLQNAIRHNIEQGTIAIKITENELQLSNTSINTNVDVMQLFQRFKKSETSTESIGLGLAIVKQICTNYNITINCTCKEKLFVISLIF